MPSKGPGDEVRCGECGMQLGALRLCLPTFHRTHHHPDGAVTLGCRLRSPAAALNALPSTQQANEHAELGAIPRKGLLRFQPVLLHSPPGWV